MARLNPVDAFTGYLNKYVTAPRYDGAERLELTAADGVRLHAVRLAGPGNAPAAVVVVHGFVNWHRTPRIHAFATGLSEHVEVVALDLRGHGHSGGDSTLGVEEALDVAAAVDAVTPGRPVVLVGTSLGGAAALLYAGRAQTLSQREIAAVVAVSAPAHWRGQTGEGLTRVRRFASSSAGRTAMAVLMRTRVGDCEQPRPDPVEAVSGVAPARTVIVHDPADWYFGREHAQALFDAAGDPRELWWVEGAGHGTDLLTPEFSRRLLDDVIGKI
ncbi:MAG TPA: alpha/beta fold hydrolase [Acidimicrobiales bacterium]|nr:alpha/beta fold hydrolase [Acidimicrobiales bacterium]